MKNNKDILWVAKYIWRYLLVQLALLPLLFGQAAAQDQLSVDKKRANSALAKATSYYDKQVSRNSFVYTGVSYFDAHATVKKNQFFIDDYWEYGSVTYDGFKFDSIYLKYDIYEDLLLIENFNSNGYLSPIKLYSPKVSFFRLHGYDFIRIERDSITKLRTGYYNLMYDGNKVQFLVKRRKEIVSNSSIGSVEEQFVRKDRYYVKKDGVYQQVRKKKSLLKLFYDQKKEVKSFIRMNSLFFKDNPDLQLKEVVKFYDSLN